MMRKYGMVTLAMALVAAAAMIEAQSTLKFQTDLNAAFGTYLSPCKSQNHWVDALNKYVTMYARERIIFESYQTADGKMSSRARYIEETFDTEANCMAKPPVPVFKARRVEFTGESSLRNYNNNGTATHAMTLIRFTETIMGNHSVNNDNCTGAYNATEDMTRFDMIQCGRVTSRCMRNFHSHFLAELNSAGALVTSGWCVQNPFHEEHCNPDRNMDSTCDQPFRPQLECHPMWREGISDPASLMTKYEPTLNAMFPANNLQCGSHTGGSGYDSYGAATSISANFALLSILGMIAFF